MSKTNTFENDMLAYIFVGTAISYLPTVTSGNYYVALLTADPTETGVTTNEATYTGYARQGILRTSGAGGWTVSGTAPTQAVNTSQVNFAACTAGTNAITHFAIMSAITGGTMLYSGALGASLAVSTGITPQIAAGGLSIQED